MTSSRSQRAQSWSPDGKQLTEKKGQEAERMEKEYFREKDKGYVHVAQTGGDEASKTYTAEYGYLVAPDFRRVDVRRHQEKKWRDYAPNLKNLDDPHVYIRQDRMDDYIKLDEVDMPVNLSVYVAEDSAHYWAPVSNLDGLSAHEKVADDKKTVTDKDDPSVEHRVYWFPLDEFCKIDYREHGIEPRL